MEVEKSSDSFKSFLLASATMSPLFFGKCYHFQKKNSSGNEIKNIMSVNVPEMKFVKEEMKEVYFPYGFVQTSAELDDTVIKLQKSWIIFISCRNRKNLVNLWQMKLKKTRRRVNALEYSTIPNLEETVKDIRMKLDENERATITRLMKVKQMLQKDA